MTILGNVHEGHWSVAVETAPAPGGAPRVHGAHEVHGADGSHGYVCEICVTHERAGDKLFEHRFRHARTFASEREAVLEGLREGMTWIELKMANAFDM
ncbi:MULTISPECIES: UDP-glucose 4-epimerase [Paraburkholderia]|uniref:UDP-glucose 4-epimerase n=1 Tax=Paraburkholderia TaxID=1822464 RepID=UPI0018F48AB2|nr:MULTISPECIES: UDP-glucose 4-epimerase [Paraburkholderia]WEY40716.1 UDP-glucose 4-epimerase [Paraburkholderia sp. SUR17]